MDRHAIEVLEFPAVLARVASHSAFSVGRATVLAIEPAGDYDEVVRRQVLAAEMLHLDQMGVDVPFAGANDIRPLLESAAKERLLEPGDLTAVANGLRACSRARATVNRLRDTVPGLGRIADRIADFPDVLEPIETAITETGEVADGASDALAATRKQLAIARQRLDQQAQAALADAVRRGLVQEALLTERNGRRVIPLKADFRGRLTGIVHDVSASGATVFIEPMAVVEAGNTVRELELAEEREIRRVLQALTSIVGARADDGAIAIVALGVLDAISATVRYGRSLRAGLPTPGDPPDWAANNGPTVLRRGRHPLLPGEVVPIDLEVGGPASGLLVTGPNTGGKTVALKTVGLLTLMVQAGIPVPCDEGSHFRVFREVFADIGDEQSIQQSLSTFSSHMRNVRHILEQAGPDTLVLLDELGAGTDPQEGAALARAILDVLLERGCTIVATTHHGELKAFAHSDPRLRNASVEFDLESLSPTYHLMLDLPGQSNALAIARRLGVEGAVIDRAETNLTAEHVELEGLLAQVRDDRNRAREEREREEAARRETEEIRVDLARRRDAIEEERAAALAATAREAQEEVDALRREMEKARRMSEREFDPAAAEERLRELDARLGRLRDRGKPKRTTPLPHPSLDEIGIGDRVRVRDIRETGEVLSPVAEDGKLEVQFGALRMKVSIDRIESAEAPAGKTTAVVSPPPAAAARTEIDVRGRRAEEAIAEIEGFLDDAFRDGAPFVRIIHGKGTGALRLALREHLRKHPLVRSLETPEANQGGEGVTVAILAG